MFGFIMHSRHRQGKVERLYAVAQYFSAASRKEAALQSIEFCSPLSQLQDLVATGSGLACSVKSQSPSVSVHSLVRNRAITIAAAGLEIWTAYIQVTPIFTYIYAFWM